MEARKEIVCGKLIIYPESRRVYVNEEEITLTKTEFDVLSFLASNPDIAFTNRQIEDALNKGRFSEKSARIRDLVCRLRAKLHITNIQTLHGYGYRFNNCDETFKLAERN